MKRPVYALVFLSFLVFDCESEEISSGTKLDYYIESYDFDELWFFTIQQKVKYQYNEAGILDKYTVLNYNQHTKLFHELRYFKFSYVNDQVNTIKGYAIGASTPYVEYSYQYSPDSRVLKIIEDDSGPGVNSEANFTYNDTDGSVKVAYSYTDGVSFEYEFSYSNQNILTDRKTYGSELCSDGVYTYDQYKNPFNDLGYVDYLLTNLSVNNKLTENIDYVNCTFPSLVPESYSYRYNDKGYPMVATTHYKSGTNGTSKRKFFYR